MDLMDLDGFDEFGWICWIWMDLMHLDGFDGFGWI